MGLDVTGRYRYPLPNTEWLAQDVEPVIAPQLPIIDAHHHLWEEGGHPYLLDEILGDTQSGHHLRATIFVQAHYGYRKHGPAHLAPLGETERVMAIQRSAAALGGQADIAAAIVGFADLTLGDGVDEVLDGHLAIAGPALRGIRHSVSRDEHFPEGIVIRPAPAGLLADQAYRKGLARLVSRDLTYDAMLYHSQLPQLCDMAQAMPDLRIVLDHVGCILGVGPYAGREQQTLQEWAANMAALARCPNVNVKIGGFGMIVCGARWHEGERPPSSAQLAQAWRPYVETCVELFGAQRCMFESNFPVDKAMYSYRTLWNAFKRIAAGWSTDEQRMLFHDTAARCYGLPLLENTGALDG